MKNLRHPLLLAFLLVVAGCAQLHHIQIGDIDNRNPRKMKKIDVKVSETGVNLEEAARIIDAAGGDYSDDGPASQIAAIIGLFQMGPTTGNKVYNDTYARLIKEVLETQCKNGRLTGLASIREARKYPVISGEIVKITGYCIK